MILSKPAMFFDLDHEAIPGQWIKTKDGLIKHHGIVSEPCLDLATNEWSITVTHATKGLGTARTTLENFSQGPLEIVGTPQTFWHQQATLETVTAQIGTPYDLFTANCEQVASQAFTGRAESKQLQGWTTLGALGAVVWILS